MAGLNKTTGQRMTGWAHCQQSLLTLVTTEFGERQMRYLLGCKDSPLLDRPGNPLEIMNFFVILNDAITPRLVNGRQYGEPRFDLARIVPSGNASGEFTFSLVGLYYPRGHLGDFSVYEAVTGVLALTDLAAD